MNALPMASSEIDVIVYAKMKDLGFRDADILRVADLIDARNSCAPTNDAHIASRVDAKEEPEPEPEPPVPNYRDMSRAVLKKLCVEREIHRDAESKLLVKVGAKVFHNLSATAFIGLLEAADAANVTDVA